MATSPFDIPEDPKAEAARYFAARGARTVPGRAKEILNRSGIGNEPRDDDRIEE